MSSLQWQAFKYQGIIYDLSHLYPFEITYIQPAKNDRPDQVYYFRVAFSLHCFTRKKGEQETLDPALLYSDSRETRVFDFKRYELSKQLKNIIQELTSRKCYHTGHEGCYFTIDVRNDDGVIEEYDVFFKISLSSDAKKKKKLTLFVQSAYLRDIDHQSNRPKKKPIDFFIIAYNTLNKKRVKVPK